MRGSKLLIFLIISFYKTLQGNKLLFLKYGGVLIISSFFITKPVFASEKTPTPRILALGDSLTAGYRLPSDQAFPAQLQTKLQNSYPGAVVFNGGISGDTTAGGLARLEWALADQPNLVIIELGANDALRGLPVDLTRQNLDDMLNLLQQRDIPVLLTGMYAPPNMGPDYGSAFNGLYPELAAKYDIMLYPFFLEGVAANPDLNQADGIHPTAEGVNVIVNNILPTVEKFIQENLI